MPFAKFSAQDYAQAMRDLMPRGRVWQQDRASIQSRVIDGLALTTQRSDGAAIRLLAGAFPATADQMVGEWNIALGIPDACYGAVTSKYSNQQQIVSKLTSSGGQTQRYFTDLAKSLGYDINIKTYTYHSVSKPVNAKIYSASWALSWKVTFPVSNTYTASVNQKINDPIGSGGYPPNLRAALCMLSKYKPSHTNMLYVFSS